MRHWFVLCNSVGQFVLCNCARCILAMRTVVCNVLFRLLSTYFSESAGLKPIDYLETAGNSTRWERWRRTFKLRSQNYRAEESFVDVHRRILRSRSLIHVERRMKMRKSSDRYFNPQANVRQEKLCFRNWLTKPSTSLWQLRFRKKAQSCEFGDVAAVDEHIRLKLLMGRRDSRHCQKLRNIALYSEGTFNRRSKWGKYWETKADYRC